MASTAFLYCYISIHAPAKGATDNAQPLQVAPSISIHAPAKGATCISINFNTVFGISIHAPAKGATQCPLVAFWSAQNFNPRSREGSDPCSCTVYAFSCNFNPRSREGSDVASSMSVVPKSAFQSTLPRRERRIRRSSALAWRYFNPRSREGSDPAEAC